MTRPRDPRNGISVVEVLVAIVLLLSATAMSTRLITEGMRSDVRAQASLEMSAIARTRMEEYRRLGYPNLLNPPPRGEVLLNGITYTWNTRITDHPAFTRLAELELTVSWKKGDMTGRGSAFRTHIRKG